jgi:hypothetical protein
MGSPVLGFAADAGHFLFEVFGKGVRWHSFRQGCQESILILPGGFH